MSRFDPLTWTTGVYASSARHQGKTAAMIDALQQFADKVLRESQHRVDVLVMSEATWERVKQRIAIANNSIPEDLRVPSTISGLPVRTYRTDEERVSLLIELKEKKLSAGLVVSHGDPE